MSAMAGMIEHSDPNRRMLAAIFLLLFIVGTCVCACVCCCWVRRLEENDGFLWEDLPCCKLARFCWRRRPKALRRTPSLSDLDSAAERAATELSPVATIVVPPATLTSSRPRALAYTSRKPAPRKVEPAPPPPEAFAFSNPDGSVSAACEVQPATTQARVESA